MAKIIRYYDPYAKEFVEIDASSWTAGERLAFHKNLGYYVNEEGQHVYGMVPENTYTTMQNGESVFLQGVSPYQRPEGQIILPGMGDDGNQAYVNSLRGETNVAPTPSGPTTDPTQGQGDQGQGGQTDQGDAAGDPTPQQPTMSLERLKELFELIQGARSPGQASPIPTGQATAQNVSTGLVSDPVVYGDVVQKERLKGLI